MHQLDKGGVELRGRTKNFHFLGFFINCRLFDISYSEVLAIQFSRQSRLVMKSNWYREVFPGTRIVRATKSEIATSSGGYRRAFSIEGGITGFGANYVIVDDPLKVGDAMSDKERQNVVSRLEDSILTRFDDNKTARLVIVMQCVHSDDLGGHLIRKGGYRVLSLSALALTDEKIQIGECKYFEREKGEAQIKDLKLGARLAAEITDNKTWREEQPAQFTVARDQIVSAIQARLSAG